MCHVIPAKRPAPVDPRSNFFISNLQGLTMAYDWGNNTSQPIDMGGGVDVSDIQLTVNQAIGQSTCSTDLNLDTLCNVLDVMRVVNAQISGTCVAP